METNIPFGVASATEIERHKSQRPDKIVSVGEFGRIAKVLWPFKTAAQLASIAGTNERTAARWLSGEFEPPVCIVLATVEKIFKRE
jgi:hypothetical protein